MSFHFNGNNSNILYSNMIGFKAQSLWGHEQIKLIKSNLIKCRFLRRGENRSTLGKTSQSREESQQTLPTYDTKSGNRTRATLVGGKCSHHYATTALYCFLFQGYVKPNAKETFISYTDMSLSKSYIFHTLLVCICSITDQSTGNNT